MRDRWTDERLDDLNAKVDHGFDRMENRFERLEARLDVKFERIEEKFDRLYRLMMTLGTAALIALIGAMATPL